MLKRLISIVFFGVLVHTLNAMPVVSDTGKVKSSHWLLPNYGKLQFAGNLGVGSIGVGYQYKRRLNLEIFAGYLPEIYSEQALFIFGVKNVFFPMSKELKRDYLLHPLGIGFLVSYSTGGNLFTTTEKFPYRFAYYGFATSIRTAVTFESSLTKQIRPDNRGVIKAIGFYDEISIVDIDLINFVLNHRIGFPSILSIALGVRVSF